MPTSVLRFPRSRLAAVGLVSLGAGLAGCGGRSATADDLGLVNEPPPGDGGAGGTPDGTAPRPVDAAASPRPDAATPRPDAATPSRPDASGKSCGGFAGPTCTDQEYCDYELDVCGSNDGPGTCRPKPGGCLEDCPGVCGCDGKWYCNACIAHAAGVDDAPAKGCR